MSGFHECPEGGIEPESADRFPAATAGLKLVKIVSTKNERNKGWSIGWFVLLIGPLYSSIVISSRLVTLMNEG